MAADDPRNIYPVTIVRDRYSGTYSGADWLAFRCESESVPEEVGGGDSTEQNFWTEFNLRPGKDRYPVGRGGSPEEALRNLVKDVNRFQRDCGLEQEFRED